MAFAAQMPQMPECCDGWAMRMKIGVVGGRTRHDEKYIYGVLDLFVQPGDTIISGGAGGVDSYAKIYALANSDIAYQEFPPIRTAPDINPYSERNQKIAETCEVLLAFPSIDSSGTWDTINKAKKIGKRIVIFQEGGS